MAALGTIGRAGGYTGGGNLRLDITTRTAGLPLGSKLSFLGKDGTTATTAAKVTIQVSNTILMDRFTTVGY